MGLNARQFEEARQAVGSADWKLAKRLIGSDAAAAYYLGSDFLQSDPTRGLFCRKLAAEISPERLLYKWPLPWLEVEDGRPASEALAEIDFERARVQSTASCEVYAAHFEVLSSMERVNARRGRASATTTRFRADLVYYLLDASARGPILEIGTYHGGTTAMFAYISAVTRRQVYAVDLDRAMVAETRDTCAHFALDRLVTSFEGVLVDFLKTNTIERPDLAFIDSDHRYVTTLAELRALHGVAGWQRPPRCVVLHDFSYRIVGEGPEVSNPVLVDHALVDFLAQYRDAPPILKRIGGYSGDGTTTTPRTIGATIKDYVDAGGTEGMMLLYS
jgi:precorrin-6B methylase 2